jgi:hypothetical protein
LNNNGVVPVDQPFIPQNDEEIAKHIAKQYIEAGIDPASAYDNPDDALGELGLKGHGF